MPANRPVPGKIAVHKQVTAPSINAVSSPGPPVLAALVLAVAGALGWAILSLPPAAPGLTRNVLSALPDSGVGNPVTAVLLNFRAYDTLLEVGVLMLAAAAVFALDRRPAEPAPPLSFSMLPVLLRLLIPLMIVVAGYLLWRGADAPGRVNVSSPCTPRRRYRH